ncbi:phosphoribosylanthranilate isomerase [Paenibacillus protaetiae]|uniref:N-(5'-phosphoribosyl)anthranilate isomerase n=1 Tax=Paenibacillus protaetiae TaxID=2509456 RepID=A0A4P6EUJ5_9BACL|nr:phosphoribosylanthranilate isomerase [Paenibacillus protaetiae]QAY66155.1 phosphoribosylanthranilate isomerase [Paenibacillus protaetiae]
MNAPRIKICGLKDKETIRSMNGLPFHEIGFVFAPSKRQVSPETAAGLIHEAKQLAAANGAAPRTVGVFVNAGLEELRSALAAAPLDVVQLHGAESPEFCREAREQLSVAVWKVFSVGDGSETPEQRFAPFKGAVDAVLIDTAGGGTGVPFDWRQIDAYKQAAAAIGVPLYVAGGLHPDNVRELMEQYAPGGVDVSSGVESDGHKDIDKIRLFVQRVVNS